MANETFDEFFRNWEAENMKPLERPVDPSDVNRIANRRAERLIEDARAKGFFASLFREAKPYGGIHKFIRSLMR